MCKDPEWTQLPQDGPVVGSGKRSNKVSDSTGRGWGVFMLSFLIIAFFYMEMTT